MPARKKDPSARARANRAPTAAVLKLGDHGKYVPLPERRDDNGDAIPWHDLTVAWWRDLWRTPMSKEYHDSDRHALFLLAALMDDYWKAKTAAQRKDLAGEIRLQRQAFGLTPYDRRRLEWAIESVDEAQARGERRRGQASKGVPQPPAEDDPRRGLHLA